MAKMISSGAFHNRFSSITIHITSCIGLKSLTKSRITNFPSTTQNHHCCPKRELPRKSIEMVNHLFYSISTAFPDREISFVRSLCYFHVFDSFLTQNRLFLRCEYIAIVQRGISIFLNFFVIKINIIINRWRSLTGR